MKRIVQRPHECLPNSLIVGFFGAILALGWTLLPVAMPASAAPPPPPGANRANPFAQFLATSAEDNRPRVFLPLRRDLRRALTRAEAALSEERYSDAFLELESILNGADTEDYFVDSSDPNAVRTSLKAVANELLSSMSAKAREAYELQFGAEARRLLREAVDRGALDELLEVSRRFQHTRAGCEASLLAGQYLLHHAKPLNAAVVLQRLVSVPHLATEFEPDASLLLASCWRLADNDEAAIRVWNDLRSRHPNARVQVRGEEESLFVSGVAPLERLGQLLGSLHRQGPATKTNWVMFRGAPSRNATAGGGTPLIRPRWQSRLEYDPNYAQTVREIHERFVDDRLPALPTAHPLAVGDYVLMRTPTKLLAVDFATGKLTWDYPWWDPDTGGTSNLAANAPTQQTFRQFGIQQPSSSDRRRLELTQRLWEDSIHGQMSSDGSTVYLVDELDYASFQGNNSRQILTRRLRGTETGLTNRLIALDLESQGKLRWAVGSSQEGDKGDEPQLADVFFLGPPLPISGQLYVLAEVRNEVRLVALDAKSGLRQWSQQIAHFEIPTHGISYNTVRRLAGATPSFADGVLVCPLTAGAVVAVDIAGRSLLWGYQYKSTSYSDPDQSVRRNRYFPPPQLGLPGKRWADSTATVASGRVLVTPIDSQSLHCLDLLTGELLWEVDRDDGLFVACVYQGVAVVVGKSSVRGLRLDDGKPAWDEIELPDGGMPTGWGFIRDDIYYFPTTQRDVVEVNVLQGSLDAVRGDKPMGNLICHRGQVISQTSEWLEAYFEIDSLRRLVDRKLQADPNDAWALEHQGMLLVDQGKYAEALGPLHRALELHGGQSNRTRGVQQLLVDTMLRALRQDFVANDELVDQVKPLLADMPARQAEFLRLVGNNLLRQRKHARAFDVFYDIAQHSARRRALDVFDMTAPLSRVDASWRAHPDRRLRATFRQLIKGGNDSDRAYIDQRLDELADSALESNRTNELVDFLTFFDGTPQADPLRLELATRLAESGSLLDAEQLLLPLGRRPGHAALSAKAAARLGEILAEGRQYQRSAFWYQTLEEFPESTLVTPGVTVSDVLRRASEYKRLGRYFQPVKSWPYGQVQIKETGRKARSVRDTSLFVTVPVLQSDLGWPEGLQVVLSRQRNVVGLRDSSGQIRRSLTLRQTGLRATTLADAYARISGHLLLLALDDEIVAINMVAPDELQEMSIAWRATLRSSVAQRSFQRRRPATALNTDGWGLPRRQWEHNSTGRRLGSDGRPVGVLGTVQDNGVCYLTAQGELRCVAPSSGSPLWTRKDVSSGAELFGDNELVFAVPSGEATARVFSRIDGEDLGSRGLPPDNARLRYIGRMILVGDTGKEKDQLPSLGLFDPWQGKSVWSRDFQLGSKAWMVEFDELAVMQPDGRFVILRIADGQVVMETDLAAEDKLASIFVNRDAERYMLIANRPFTSSNEETRWHAWPQGERTMRVNGRVYAFDRISKSPRWQVPAVIENHSLLIDQPVGVPVLTFMRQEMSKESGRSNAQVSVLCIDKRNGCLLFPTPNQTSSKLQPSSGFDVTGNLEERIVTLSFLNRTSYQLTFTDAPRAPEPPAQTGTASSQPQPSEGSWTWGSFRKLFENLTPSRADETGS